MQIKSNQLVLKTDCGIFVDPGSAIAARLLSCPGTGYWGGISEQYQWSDFFWA
jgi:hypothetical protein